MPAVLLQRGGDQFLFDCGEGTQRQLLQTVGLPEMQAVFITHHHLDHWLGLPGMLKSFDLRDRHAPLQVYGPPGTKALMSSLRGLYGRLRYPLEVVDLEVGDVLEWDDFELHALGVRHRGAAALGFSLVERERPGRFDAELAQELGVRFGPDFGRLQAGETVSGVKPEQVIGPPRPGRKVVLSGDTSPCDMVRVAADGAELLVHEATFLDEAADRARETGHTTARQAAQLGAEADVAMLALTHVSTRYAGHEIRDEARAVFERTVVPRDFDTIEVPFPEKGPPVLARWQQGERVPT